MSQIFPLDAAKQAATNSNEVSARKNCQTYGSDECELFDGQQTINDDNEAITRVMKQSHWKIKTNLKSKRADFKKICSICLADSSSVCGQSSKLITPCLCVGTRSHQHEQCIEEWIEQTGAASCPFCNVHYEFTRKKKSFMSYVRDCELEQDFLVGLAAFAFTFYLFLVGLAVCYHYLFAIYKCDPQTLPVQNVDKLVASSNWSELEKIVECHKSTRDFNQAHSWPSLVLFCVVCTATVLLAIGIISAGLNTLLRHYVKYLLWSRTNFKVTIKPYRLDGLTSAIISDGLQTNESG